MENPDLCIICEKSLSNDLHTVKLSQKGANTINEASRVIKSNVIAVAGRYVHIVCRKNFTNKKQINVTNLKNSEDTTRKSIRLAESPVSSATHCLFCEKLVDFSCKRKPRIESQKVRTVQYAETIRKCCELRGDEWSFEVSGRLEFYTSDLVAADCVYHKSCSTNFRNGKNIPYEYSSANRSSGTGRPANEDQHQAFLRTCEYLEDNDEEQMVLDDIIFKMEEFLKESESSAYNRRHMKRKLLEHYGENIIITDDKGKPDVVVTLRESANNILRSYYQKTKLCDIKLQKIHLMEAAAKIIRSDVKSIEPSAVHEYPSLNDLTIDAALNFIPSSLKLLLSKLFVGKDPSVKIAAVGQTIMQGIRPRALICPLQMGLSI